ncbi:MAG: cysteine synthase A [Bacilli bacterium]|nr:cysteine synthase A [Bacilli bacterium]
MKIYESVSELIGKTPLLHLNNIKKHFHLEGEIYAKIERMEPSGSTKDRAAKYLILEALKKGLINKDTLLIEPTSGNTGIALAMLAASLELKLVIYMPSNCSVERIKMMKAYGAEVILTETSKGMGGAIEEANKRHQEISNSYILGQFDNSDNVLANYETTGPEIYEALDGKLDIFVAAVGTGGTFTGVAKYLKERNPQIKAVAAEPSSSPFLSEGKKGPHKIQGIGAGFKPGIMDISLADEIMTISDEEAYEGCRLLAKIEGICAGISSGANLMAAIKLAQKEKKTVVSIFPDNGERYLSVEGLYE